MDNLNVHLYSDNEGIIEIRDSNLKLLISKSRDNVQLDVGISNTVEVHLTHATISLVYRYLWSTPVTFRPDMNEFRKNTAT